jgi:hypothetical protein
MSNLLVDKVGAQLPGWKGRLLTQSGRLALVNSVLTSLPVYHMTSIPLSKWAIKRIDRIQRNFLWKGQDDLREGTVQSVGSEHVGQRAWEG